MAPSSTVPVYTIDLSRPPFERYNEVIEDFRHEICHLTPLFEEIVRQMGLPLGLTTRLARLLLRRLHDKEQTEEIRGISKASGVDMYLLVCFNTLLDLLMGCTSGAARVRMDSKSPDTQMLHFRTLDWEMDPLRKVVVQLEFVNKPHGAVIARSITYAGFVGTLTGLRKGLSMSLNFRPYHNDSHSLPSNIRFNLHRLAVLLGLRPSIASSLRSFLLPSGKIPTLDDLESTLPSTPSTAAYLTFSDGQRAVVFEKDHLTATVNSSTSFVTITNHDVTTKGNQDIDLSKLPLLGMQDLIEDSQDRLQCIEGKWNKVAATHQKAGRTDIQPYATSRQLVTWVNDWPTTNETTHYATVMNPITGEIEYITRYLEAVKEPTK
ncbi:beta subunit of N-acylethanolamine-hydrolyzing acid amidase-domain-containing protein [Elsinoe ampelina]|uniref:ceramidase n=1 Tax=Elsinoe ampelina TaxID=302913 RepID=A0A6A6GKT7_9PEZI|nr:beta subunit of N-acylethanolamine-hydrolyzing acid amidase-domain-containing protein [Elsinoe ampelina]